MTAQVGIGSTYCLLPDQRTALADLPEFESLTDEQAAFAAGTGIHTVGVFDGAEQGSLAAIACRELVAADPGPVDVLLMVGARAPDVLLGSDVCRVQAESKLTGAFAFTVDGLGCAGSSAAWGLARDLLTADPGRDRIVITHASRPTGVDRVRSPVTVVGDGAYATTMVRGGRPVLRAHRMETDGTFHDLFRVDYKQTAWYEWREVCQSTARYRFGLAVHSRLRLQGLVEQVLADAGEPRSAIAATLMQNITVGAYEFYTEQLGLPIHPICAEHLGTFGHLGAMDVVLNLDRLLATGALSPGDLVLVLNNSPVAAWAATLWEV